MRSVVYCNVVYALPLTLCDNLVNHAESSASGAVYNIPPDNAMEVGKSPTGSDQLTSLEIGQVWVIAEIVGRNLEGRREKRNELP